MDTKHVIVLPYDERWEQDFLLIVALYPNDLEKYIEYKSYFYRENIQRVQRDRNVTSLNCGVRL